MSVTWAKAEIFKVRETFYLKNCQKYLHCQQSSTQEMVILLYSKNVMTINQFWIFFLHESEQKHKITSTSKQNHCTFKSNVFILHATKNKNKHLLLKTFSCLKWLQI